MESKGKDNQFQAKWYHFVFAFFAGVFLMNTLPHLINGIIGNRFPTPFADPPGKGLSSPTLNVLWATINFALGCLFIYLGKISSDKKYVLLTLFSGSIGMAFYLASYFGKLFNGH